MSSDGEVSDSVVPATQSEPKSVEKPAAVVRPEPPEPATIAKPTVDVGEDLVLTDTSSEPSDIEPCLLYTSPSPRD